MITDDTRPSNVTSTINKTLTFAANHGRDSSISSGKNESKYFEAEEYAVYLDRSDALEKRGSSGIDLPSEYAQNLDGGDSPTQTFHAEIESQK